MLEGDSMLQAYPCDLAGPSILNERRFIIEE